MICKISIYLADSCIFIQNGTLLPTGISFPNNKEDYSLRTALLIYHSSLITHHFSLYARGRAECRQCRCQNRYNDLYHRLPCFLFHSL